MEAITRWSARLDVKWKPVLTFGRRRFDYLEWLDREVDPVSFFETEDAVGAAPTSVRQRLSVTRRGASLELRSPQSEIGDLTRVLEGAFEIFAPASPALKEYRGHWSMPLAADYMAARRRLVRRLLPAGFPAAGGEVEDGAFLITGTLDEVPILLEYGVVDAEELQDRVEHPDPNRLGGAGLPEPLPSRDAAYPACSLYLDLNWSPDVRMLVKDAGDAVQRLAMLENKITKLMTDLAQSVDL